MSLPMAWLRNSSQLFHTGTLILFYFVKIIFPWENMRILIPLHLDKTIFKLILLFYMNFIAFNLKYNITDTIAVDKKIFANEPILFTHMNFMGETRIY